MGEKERLHSAYTFVIGKESDFENDLLTRHMLRLETRNGEMPLGVTGRSLEEIYTSVTGEEPVFDPEATDEDRRMAMRQELHSYGVLPVLDLSP